MAELFATGRAVDLALGVMALEFLALLLVRLGGLARLGRRAGPRHPSSLVDLGATLAAGAALLLALRAALRGAAWQVIALWLIVGFLAHLIDLWRRLPHRTPDPSRAVIRLRT